MLNGFSRSDRSAAQNRNERLPKAAFRITHLSVGLFLLLISTLVVAAYWFHFEHTPYEFGTSIVRRHSFMLHVHERGIVRPARVVAVKSQISSNRAKLVWLEQEGKEVSKGSVIARFDTQPFIDALEQAELKLADTRARLRDAEKVLQIQEQENAAKLEAARHKLEIAEIEAEDLRSGTGRLQRQRLRMAVTQAQRAEQIARDELNDFEELLRMGHISQHERDVLADKLRKHTEALDLARHELDNFDRYEMPRLLREAQLNVDAARNELARERRTAALELKHRNSEVVKQQRDGRVFEQQLDNARTDVENSDVRAPIAGTLLHVTLPREMQSQKIQIGDAIWFGQTFLEIPDTHDLVVEINVREIDVAKLALGMEAIIELDAFPGRVIKGEVVSVNSLAQSSATDEAVSRFTARVRMDEPAAGVHVGMSADVKIIYRQLDEVIAVPTAAIEYHDGVPTVRLKEGDQTRRIRVELGEIGSQFAQVVSGLDVGDEVEVNAM